MTVKAEHKFMHRALELAKKGRGTTSPNPMVGAVIVKNRCLISEGYHQRSGADHAEIVAIKKAGKRAKGATIFVTLEPCCHTGQTGPCTQAIIDAGIKVVHYAVGDPDQRVRGKGARQLRQAGIEVHSGLLRKEAVELNEIYFGFHKLGRPFVTLKMAQSLDGRIATSTGDSRWISSPDSRKIAHQLRAENDAVLVGMGTVANDNPKLNVRHGAGTDPYRIVLSQSLKFPKRCGLIDDNGDYKTVVASDNKAIERFCKSRRKKNLIFWSLKTKRNGSLDLNDFLRKAVDFGLRSILIEGGSQVATSFLNAGLVDKVVLFTAPKIIGNGINAIGELSVSKVVDAMTFERSKFEVRNTDCIFTGYPRRGR